MNRIIAVLLMVATPTVAMADTPAGPEAPGRCTEPMTVYSPCEGTLLPFHAAKEGLLCLTEQVPKLQLKLSRAEALHRLEVERLEREKGIERKRGDEYLKLAERAIDAKDEAESVWAKPHVAYPVGVLLGALLTASGVLVLTSR